MDNLFEARQENWNELHRVYAGMAMEAWSAGGAMTTQAEAWKTASEEMGRAMEPAMTGEEFRKWDTGILREFITAKARRNLEVGPVAGGAAWLREHLFETAPLPVKPAEKIMNASERAELLLKGMKPGEVRFEVCLTPEHAVSIQKSLNYWSVQLHWGQNSYNSTVVTDEVHQAGSKRTLLAVTRIK